VGSNPTLSAMENDYLIDQTQQSDRAFRAVPKSVPKSVPKCRAVHCYSASGIGPQISSGSISGSRDPPRMIAMSCWSVIASIGPSPRSIACTTFPSNRSPTSRMACMSPCSAFSANFSAMTRRRRPSPLNSATRSMSVNGFCGSGCQSADPLFLASQTFEASSKFVTELWCERRIATGTPPNCLTTQRPVAAGRGRCAWVQQ
jgi:hypothetical protein